MTPFENLTIMTGNILSRGEKVVIDSQDSGPFLYGFGRKPVLIATGRLPERKIRFAIRFFKDGTHNIHAMDVFRTEAREIESFLREIIA